MKIRGLTAEEMKLTPATHVISMSGADLKDAELRRLRDNIYGPGNDKNWNECKEFWHRDEQWLRDNQPQLV